MSEYIIDCGFDRLHVRANLADAAAQIELVTDDGHQSTGYQTADAHHRVREMAILAVLSCGRDWYVDPSADFDGDDRHYIDLRVIRSIREVA